MTGIQYQKLAMRTAPDDSFASREERLFHGVFGLASEAGEVAGILQKTYQGHGLDDEHIKKELGDCLWMIAECCTALGCTIDEVMRINISKLMERYPEGFSADRSLHRAEGDI